eukprot:8004306-Alexandrium_andersonii.AAC.1
MPKSQNHVRRSELKLRGPRNDLKIDVRSSRTVRSAPFPRWLRVKRCNNFRKVFRRVSEGVPR